MKVNCFKQIIVISSLFLCFNAIRCEWQWTKETGWVNIKKIRLGKSGELNKEGIKLLKKGRCEESAQYFIGAYKTSRSDKFSQKVLINLARAWICANKNYRAYSVMKLFIEKYPYSPYLEEVIKLQYEIGFNFLKGAKKEIWGVALLPAKSIGHNIIQKLIEKYPYSPHTKENLLKYANLLFAKKEYNLAATYYKKFVELYPESEYASFAVVKMFQSKQNAIPEKYYDKTTLEEMENELTKLDLSTTKKAIIEKEKYKKIKESVENLKAKADFETALYYIKTGKKNAAITYLKAIIEEYPDSIYAKNAIEELEKLSNKK